MANTQRRQKKLERRTAKRKQRHRELKREEHIGLAERLAPASSAPILHCCTTPTLWEEGMSNVLISRETARGGVGFVMFLVDMYCLGVKDVFGNMLSRGEYMPIYRNLAEQYEIVPLEPADLRKLVEGAVDYARSVGLEPHRDYRKATTIFGDIDPAESTRNFEYGGKVGKPHFVAGPNDDPFRCQQITSILESVCGPDGYLVTIPLQARPGFGIDDDVLYLDD